jgi:hypothetical protein
MVILTKTLNGRLISPHFCVVCYLARPWRDRHSSVRFAKPAGSSPAGFSMSTFWAIVLPRSEVLRRRNCQCCSDSNRYPRVCS